MKNRTILFLSLLIVLFTLRSANFGALTASDVFLSLAITVAALYPLVRWVLNGMVSLPLFECFSFFHFPYYAYPILAAKQKFMVYGESDRWYAEVVILVFLISANFAYYYHQITFRASLTCRKGSIWQRELSGAQHLKEFAILLALWASISLLNSLGYGGLFGANLNLARSIGAPGGVVASFFLFFNLGSGRLSWSARFWLITTLVTVVICEISTGFLVTGGIYVIVALLGYTLARKKIPVLLVVFLAGIFQFLHLGKSEMRNEFWDAESTRQSTGITRVVDVYQHWIGASWERFLSKDDEEQEKASIFDRANLIQMVALVVHDTPVQRPFIKGQTYAQIPLLLIPRFIWPAKPRGSLPTETLGIYYEIQDEEGVNFTSIGFGMIAEAWANFGWLGVMAIGLLFGWLSGIGVSLSRGLTASSVGYLLAVMLLAWTFQLEQTLGPFFISMAQSLFFGILALLYMSRRRNPWRLHTRIAPASIGRTAAANSGVTRDPGAIPVNPKTDSTLAQFKARQARVTPVRSLVKGQPLGKPNPGKNLPTPDP